MIRRLLVGLVFGLFGLLVLLAVVFGGYALATGSGDAAASRTLWYLAMSLLMLVVADLILLIAALGIQAIGDRP